MLDYLKETSLRQRAKSTKKCTELDCAALRTNGNTLVVLAIIPLVPECCSFQSTSEGPTVCGASVSSRQKIPPKSLGTSLRVSSDQEGGGRLNERKLCASLWFRIRPPNP